MLSVETPFPHTGSHGFVRHTAEPVRILRRNADGSVLLQLTDRAPAQRRATDNFTRPLADIVATEAEARDLPAMNHRRSRSTGRGR